MDASCSLSPLDKGPATARNQRALMMSGLGLRLQHTAIAAARTAVSGSLMRRAMVQSAESPLSFASSLMPWRRVRLSCE